MRAVAAVKVRLADNWLVEPLSCSEKSRLRLRVAGVLFGCRDRLRVPVKLLMLPLSLLQNLAAPAHAPSPPTRRLVFVVRRRASKLPGGRESTPTGAAGCGARRTPGYPPAAEHRRI